MFDQCLDRRFDLFDVIDALGSREEGDLSKIHVGLDNGLTGQSHLDLIASWKSVDRPAGSAYSPAASTSPDQLIPGILHRLLNGEGSGNLISLSHDENGN